MRINTRLSTQLIYNLSSRMTLPKRHFHQKTALLRVQNSYDIEQTESTRLMAWPPKPLSTGFPLPTT